MTRRHRTALSASGAWTRHDGEFADNEPFPWVEFRIKPKSPGAVEATGRSDRFTDPVPFSGYSV